MRVGKPARARCGLVSPGLPPMIHAARYLIYGLIDPRTRLVRYVGKSTNGMRRPKDHRQPSRVRLQTHVACWVRSLLAQGLDYEIVVLETCTAEAPLFDSERWWVAFGRACGWPLTNLTDGGDGSSGAKRSEANREQMRERMLGDRNPAKRLEVRALISRNSRGIKRTRSAEHNAKIAAAHAGRPKHTPESRARLREIALRRWERA